MPKALLVFVLLTLAAITSTSQNISGIVNEYTSVTSIYGCDSSSLMVSSANNFFDGDKVILIQMKGAVLNLSNTSDFGNIENLNNVGNYEINRIKSIQGNEIHLSYKITRDYDLGGIVQLVRMPEYDNANVVGLLTCKPWDGQTGGVLAIDVKGVLSLQSDITVNEKGYRGGELMNENTFIDKETNYFYSSPVFAGAKGEGVGMVPMNQRFGRGRAANGGGGGNAHNAGGGGGGNGGKGGNGGLEYYNTPFSPTPGTNGIGGIELYKNEGDKIILGGGGGAGHSNDNRGTSGGTGGGIIIIISESIQSNGFSISSNGGDVFSPGTDRNDGQGGGGAGGSILIQANQISGALNCELKGGQGGSCLFYVQSQIIGPGGGGSGGKFMLSKNHPTIVGNLQGGVNGIANQNMTNGAEMGENGSLLLDVYLWVDTISVSVVPLSHPLSLCPGSSVSVNNQTFTAPTIFLDTIPGIQGCDTVITYIIEYAPYDLVFRVDSLTCGGGQTDLHYTLCNLGSSPLPDSVTVALYDNNPTTSAATHLGNLTITAAGPDSCYSGTYAGAGGLIHLPPGTYPLYAVINFDGSLPTPFALTDLPVTDIEECNYENNLSSTVVRLPLPPPLDLGPDLAFCHDSTVLFSAGPDFVAYLWHDGSTEPDFSSNTSGTFWVEATDACGTVQRDSVTLIIEISLAVVLPDTAICPGASFELTVPGFDTYDWSPATGLSCSDCATIIVAPDNTTTYTLTATTAAGCVSVGSFEVTVLPLPPALDLGPDLAFCHDSTVLFSAGPDFVAYLWHDGSTEPDFSSNTSGTFWVEATDACGTVQRDSVTLIIEIPLAVVLPDTAICPGASFELTVPGFDTYDWSPATGLSCSDCATVIVAPDNTTTYTLTATTAAGCVSVGSFEVTVLPLPPALDLGPDLAFCHDSTVLFSAGPDFVAYLWHDGSTEPDFSSNTSGTFWVEATDACGTVQRDSVTLIIEIPLAVVLPDTAICPGASFELTVPGFDTYDWSPATGLSCSDCATIIVAPDNTTTYTLTATAAAGCVSVGSFEVTVLPLNTRAETITFCPGESVVIGGQAYTMPSVVLDTVPGLTGCDTVVTYTLQYTDGSLSTAAIQCPGNISIAVAPGGGGTTVQYAQPTEFSDCPCPGLAVTRTAGPSSGGFFPTGITQVCYQLEDSCANVAQCCFTVTVLEESACDVKEIGCMKYELLGITQNNKLERTYSIRVTNKCPNPMSYTAIQLPDGVTARAPKENTVFTTSPGNRDYLVRNPNFSPFYSIRFKTMTDSIANGQSDVFRYTLPPQSEPVYIHITSRLEPQTFYEAHLNTFYCPVIKEQQAAPVAQHLPGALQVFPNPTQGGLFADLSDWSGEPIQINILHGTGQSARQITLIGTHEPMYIALPEALPAGLYILDARTSKGERRTARFVVQP